MRTSLAPLRALRAVILAQRGHLFAWVPVALALGIGLYFSLRWEPELRLYLPLGFAVAGFCWLAYRAGPALGPCLYALALVGAGFCLAGARAHLVGAPVLEFRYYGPVEGRVVALDRSQSDRLRVTLDRVVLSNVEVRRLPGRVRVALHGREGESFVQPTPGMRVMMTAHLSPPAGPVEPGGFDFRRLAWFRGLGAVGYTTSPVMRLSAGAGGWRARLFALRVRLSHAVQARLPGKAGGFAAAIIAGDRAAVARDVLLDLRAANIAHLLAISGLHMGLLTGFVFAALRVGLALFPPLALRVPARKLAAGVALPVAFGYLMLSGGSVSTERAFVMVAVMLIAVMLDRRALTLRAVALAAVIVLAWRPESLVAPGFQMSFAATTALIAVFGWLRDWRQARPDDARQAPRWLRPVLAVVISSVVAGAATAPIAAFHFNRISEYGLLANLASVPVMGVVVMPAAVTAMLLWPLRLEDPAFSVLGAGIRWILGVAERVAGWDGAIYPVMTPPGAVLPLLALGSLVVILWQGRMRGLGIAPLVLALALWSGAERPEALISANGRLVGVMGGEGRMLSKPRGDGFTALSWLENDGDAAAQEEAAARSGAARVDLAEFRRTPDVAALRDACAAGKIILAPDVEIVQPGCVQIIDRALLAALGAIAVRREGGKLHLIGALEVVGDRLWSRTGVR